MKTNLIVLSFVMAVAASGTATAMCVNKAEFRFESGVTSAGDNYMKRGNRVYYNGRVVNAADAKTFIDLGYGYGRDAEQVFYCGELLPYVDPNTFRLTTGNNPLPPADRPGPGGHRLYNPSGGYYNDKFNAYYDGKKIPGSSGTSFRELGMGYAKDAFNVYYLGRKISDASQSSFIVLEYGYSKDAFNVYYLGRKVQDASPSSFKVDRNGYAKDAFNTYFNGKALNY